MPREREPKKYLHDIAPACDLITGFTREVDFKRYCDGDLRRSAVERQFEIIGEALNQLAKLDSAVAEHDP